ncbi:MAG: hypothetical protein AB1450_13350 [Pseudomonadota bacterium]
MKTMDKREIYFAQIQPLLGQIRDICKEHQLPLVCAVQIAVDTEGATLGGAMNLYRDKTTVALEVAAAAISRGPGAAAMLLASLPPEVLSARPTAVRPH